MKEEESKTAWSIELGLYPGVLFGVRTYNQIDATIVVFYLPFIDIAYTRYL